MERLQLWCGFYYVVCSGCFERAARMDKEFISPEFKVDEKPGHPVPAMPVKKNDLEYLWDDEVA